MNSELIIFCSLSMLPLDDAFVHLNRSFGNLVQVFFFNPSGFITNSYILRDSSLF